MKQLSRRKVLQSTSLAAAGLALGIPRHTFARVGAPLLVHSQSPPNAEPRLPDLIKSWKTANELFYVRSHADAPKLAPKDFKVSVGGMVRRPISMTAAALKDRFKQYTVDATLTCAGNRRTEHSAIKKVGGVPWMAGAIGNATWGGIALSELLRLVEPTAEAKYVWFEGADEIEKNSTIIPFGASIPIEKAMAMHGQNPRRSRGLRHEWSTADGRPWFSIADGCPWVHWCSKCEVAAKNCSQRPAISQSLRCEGL